jgi:small-conductance mechanosensitive channel
MDIKQINSAIMFGTWTDTELGSMIDAIKFARASLTKQVARSIKVGSVVRYNSPRQGMTVQGTVKKVAIKYATVATPQGLWKVPMNMLEAVA